MHVTVEGRVLLCEAADPPDTRPLLEVMTLPMVMSSSTPTPTADGAPLPVTPDLGSELVGHEHGSLRYPPPPPREILDAAGELLRALAAPVRIAIVLQLRESQRCVHELVDALGVPQPLVSQHLKILKAAGVVAGERSGREVLYRLADHHLAHIVVDAVAHAAEDMP
jgi:ArsR family transcriptional regulator, zinc-responsive transcriptional repressor